MVSELEMKMAGLIKRTQSMTLSKVMNGDSYLVAVNSKKNKVVDVPSIWLQKLGLVSKNLQFYWVKGRGTPFIIKEIDFKWEEGTTEIGLDFLANFEISVRSETDAQNLVKQLNNSTNLFEGLHNIINEYLHECMTDIYRRCVDRSINLMDEFSASGAAAGESLTLNDMVSNAVLHRLGIANFRIGFRLKHKPPMQIEITHLTKFEVADSDTKREVETRVLLYSSNYQLFRRSGLKGEQDTREAIIKSVENAVKEQFFGKGFFQIVKNFKQNELDHSSQSIRDLIEARIRKDAKGIGYTLDMFQTLPKIPMLALAEGMRVEMVSEDDELLTKNSTGNVKINITIEVKAKDFDLLKNLIDPDAEDIEMIVRSNLRQICKDEIQKIERKEFNLSFDDVVSVKLKDAITRNLGERYGLDINFINISQLQTEDGERFGAILKKACPFAFNILPLASAGATSAVKISAVFEITGMAENGWEAFESKDFGFKKDSLYWLPQRKEEIRKISGKDESSEDYEVVRKNFAIDNELNEIGKRISNTLEAKFSKIDDVADYTRLVQFDREIRQAATGIAQKAIEAEFGLIVELREFNRELNSEEVLYQQEINVDQSVYIDNLNTRKDLVEARNKGDVDRLNQLMERKEQLSEDDMMLDVDDQLDDINQEIEKIVGPEKNDRYNVGKTGSGLPKRTKKAKKMNLEQSLASIEYEEKS